MENTQVIVYTDGGSRGNPGIAGAGAYITDENGKELKEVSKFLGTKTNNWAEYEAVVIALEALKKMYGPKTKTLHVDMHMDSQLVARQLNGEYQIKEETLFPQFIKIWNMRVKDFPHITFSHVPREQNKDADRLANLAMDQGK